MSLLPGTLYLLNLQSGFGGGIAVGGYSKVVVASCELRRNFATHAGAGIYVGGPDVPNATVLAQLTVEDTLFEDCHAVGFGGALAAGD